MDKVISFSEDDGDVEVSVEIRASLNDIVSLMLLINFGFDIGVQEVSDLSGIYTDLMNQVSQYCVISEQGDVDND
jgi:hypothetical protein